MYKYLFLVAMLVMWMVAMIALANAMPSCSGAC